MTGSTALVLRPATSADVEGLAAILARAFYDDPPTIWLLPDPATRLARLTRMFATAIGIEALQHGGVDIAWSDAEMLGGAVWLPPGHWEPGLREKIQALPHYVRVMAGGWGRALPYGRALGAAHPTEPHWYLKAIGVDPGSRGRGVAGLLLRSRLERCDAGGNPAYLEASTPSHVPLYERFGFRRTGDIRVPEGAPVLTAMWRTPAGAPPG